ncbi:hypothetical protein BDW74DRAFT_184918 [Aspergillus multicolor]|uniref:uncharacterized protein n=1 Tax=Aspergillus multicolor TaxID=41759 RepID=UPI003CCE2FC9
MSTHTVGVFPASGGIGGSTVKHLLTRLPAKDPVFIARSPEKLEAASPQGATVRKANYNDDSSLEHAFDGITTLFLISYASVQHHHRTQRQKAAIDAAIRSGVQHIFYASLAYAGKHAHNPSATESVAFVMQAHLDTERYLDECAKKHGIGYTVVRQGLYTEGFPMHLTFFDVRNPADTIPIPHDGSGPGVAWVKQEELGEGNTELLRRFVADGQRSPFAGETVTLTGPRALSSGQTVEILSKITGKQINIKVISGEEWAAIPVLKENLTYDGCDYSLAMASTFEAVRRGEGAYVSPLLGEFLGRAPEEFEATVTGMAMGTSPGQSFWGKN